MITGNETQDVSFVLDESSYKNQFKIHELGGYDHTYVNTGSI